MKTGVAKLLRLLTAGSLSSSILKEHGVPTSRYVAARW